MKILVIDRDQLASQMVTSRLEADGHEIATEAVKNEGLERVSKEDFDLIFVDPSPMKDARVLALNIRRAARVYPYLMFMTTDEDVENSNVMQMGCNDYVLKPIDQEELHIKIDNAQRLKVLFDRLGDVSEDFPSAGGVISKSAFNQLCLSAMERGGRYNELAFVLAISIENYKEIKDMDGAYNADFSVSKMAHHMVRMRRMSDIIGQTGVNEYSILLQRTKNNEEAMEAAKRFAATFDEIDDFIPDHGNPISIRITLTHLPTGACPFDYKLEKKLDYSKA